MTILFQNVFLVLLLWYYMKDRPSNLGIVIIIAGFIATAGACAMLPSDYMVLLPLSNLPLIFLAKVPQARQRASERERKGITPTNKLASLVSRLQEVEMYLHLYTNLLYIVWRDL